MSWRQNKARKTIYWRRSGAKLHFSEENKTKKAVKTKTRDICVE